MSEYYIKNGENYEKVDAFNQDELEVILEKRLSRERAKYADYEDLKTKAGEADTLKTDFEAKLAEAQKQNEDLATQLKEARLATEKANILREFNIKSNLSEFVTGSSVDEMRRRAEKLSKNVASSAIEIDKSAKPVAEKDGLGKLRDSLFGTSNE